MLSIFKTLDKHYVKFGQNKIDIVFDLEHNVWFNAKSIALALKYKQPKLAIIKYVKAKHKSQLKHIITHKKIKKHPQSVYITESGLYSLILSSRMTEAKQFKDWVVDDVLPSIRKYGFYKLKKKYKNKIHKFVDKINYLEKININMKNDLKKEKFPDGALFYVIDFSEDGIEIYKIGICDDLKSRKQIYNTHTFHKKKVVYTKEFKNPIKLETCLKAMLYDYIYKNKKEMYICKLSIIKKAVKNCIRNFNNMNKFIKNQTGGGNIIQNLINEHKLSIDKYKHKIIKINHKLN
jgi:prophage antirepressor-like protein